MYSLLIEVIDVEIRKVRANRFGWKRRFRESRVKTSCLHLIAGVRVISYGTNTIRRTSNLPKCVMETCWI